MKRVVVEAKDSIILSTPKSKKEKVKVWVRVNVVTKDGMYTITIPHWVYIGCITYNPYNPFDVFISVIPFLYVWVKVKLAKRRDKK